MASASRRRKVRFNPSVLVASFHFEWAPARLIRPILSPWPKPRPSQSLSAPYLKLRRVVPGRCLHGLLSRKSPNRSLQTSSPSLRPAYSTALASSELAAEPGWQTVIGKRRGWAKAPVTSHPPSSSVKWDAFKKFMVGRCYNCLAKDHTLSQCRDPTKCWYCKRNGHISSKCN
jgi:hypothetical protein